MYLMSNISQYLGYVQWNYLFLIFLLGALIGGLFALVRGIYSSTCKYIVKGILIVILVLVMPTLVNMLCALDLSSINFKMTINGSEVYLTTIDDFVIDVVDSLNLVNSTSDPSIHQTALALGHSVVGLVLFLVGMILIFILTPFIGSIVYLLTFAIFMSKERRKHKKHRFVATCEGAICGTVVASLFLAPFSSLLNISSYAADEIKKTTTSENVEESDYQQIIDLLSTYNDSAFYTMISFGNNDSSQIFDTQLMGQITKTTLNGTTTSVYDVLGTLLQVFSSLGDSIKINIADSGEIKVVIDYAKLLLPATISSVLDKISSWKLLMYMVPAFVEIGLNKTDIDATDLDLSDIDYSDTVTSIKDIYMHLYDTGLIESYLVPGLETGEYASTFVLDINKKEDYKAAINAVLDTNVISKNIPIILASLGSSLDLNYLSSDVELYKSLDYKATFDSLIDFIFYAFNIMGITEISSDTFSTLSDKLIESLEDKEKESNIISLLSGGNITLKIDSQEQVVSYDGLVNLSIFSSNIVSFSKLLVSIADSNEILYDYLTKDELIELGNKMQEVGLASEIKGLVKCLSDLNYLSKQAESDNFDFTNQEVLDALSNVLDSVDSTVVIKTFMPKMIKNFLLNNKDDIESNLMGLKIEDFDFDAKDSEGNSIFASELNKVVKILGKLFELSDVINENQNDTKALLQAINTDDLKEILTVIASNKVINPDKSLSGGSTIVKNSNLNKFLKSIFKDEAFANLGITLPEDLSSIEYLGDDGEINHLVNVFKYIQQDGVIDLLTNSNLELKDINPDYIEELFSYINQSELLKNSLPEILNKNLSSSLNDLGVSIDFYNVTDWDNEGKCFAKVITNLNNLPSTDFSQVDWFSLPTEQVNALLTTLSKLELFSVKQDSSGRYVDNFGNIIYHLISSSSDFNSILGNSYSKDNFSIVSDEATGTLKTDFSSWSKNVTKSSYSYTNDNGDTIIVNNQYIDQDGEISKICKTIKSLVAINKDNFDYKTDLTGTQLSEILHNVKDSYCFSDLLPSIINYATSQIGSVQIMTNQFLDMELINANYLNELDDSQVDAEIDGLVEIYSSIVDNEDLFETFDNLTGEETTYTFEQIGMIEDLLNDIANLNITRHIRVGKSITFFDSTLSLILNFSGLDKTILGISDSTLAKELMLSRIKQISSNENTGKYAGITWGFDSSYSTLSDVSTTVDSTKNTVTSERSEAVINNNSSQILQITKILRYTKMKNISINALDGSFSESGKNSVTGEDMNFILSTINESWLFHSNVSSMFEKAFKTMKIESYLSTEKYATLQNNLNSHKDFDLTIESNGNLSGTNYEYWDDNISNFCDLYDTIMSNAGGEVDLSKISFDNLELIDIITPSSNMPVFNNVKENLMYNLLANVGTSFNPQNYIRGTTTSEKELMIHNLLFKDDWTSSQKQVQYEIIDIMLQEGKTLSGLEFDSTNTNYNYSALSESIYNIGLSTISYGFENNEFYNTKGLFANELLANLLKEKFQGLFEDNKTGNEYQFFETIFFKENDYEQDYKYLNIIEYRGLKGLISLTNPTFDQTYFETTGKTNGYDLFKQALTLMGRNYDDTTDLSLVDKEERLLQETERDLTLTKYVSSDNQTRLVNSRIAITLFNYYSDKIVVKETTAGKTTLKDVIETYNNLIDSGLGAVYGFTSKIDIEANSFEASADSIIAAIEYVMSL